ncbi:MAG: hypothetical protein N3G19_00840 [Candidatus Pacearchaeota archaeon]|nr:hypothetical protein [Candidatus Pacearchaeota archaeon]
MLKALLFFLVLGNNSDNNYSKINKLDEILNKGEQTECLTNTNAFTLDIDTISFGYKLFKAAEKYLGVPYAWGAEAKRSLIVWA